MAQSRSILTSRQQEELNFSILSYLHQNGLGESAAAFAREVPLDGVDPADSATFSSTKFASLLEKKWTSVVRLQRKVIELEKQVAELQTELAAAPVRVDTSTRDWLPRAPEKFILTGHRSPVTQVSFHPVYTVVASSSEDATIKLWDYDTGHLERTCRGHTNTVQDLAYSPNGNLLASCSADLTIKLWDASDDYTCVRTLIGHDHNVSSVAFIQPRGELLVSASRDNTIRIWNITSGHCVRTITSAHSDWVRRAIPSHAGAFIASCSNDQLVKIWDTRTGNCLQTMGGHSHVVECVVWAPHLAEAPLRELLGLPKVTAAAARRAARESAVPGSPDGTDTTAEGDGPAVQESLHYVATGSRDRTIKLWDTRTGQCVHTFNGHDNWVRALAFHPSGKFLLSVADDKTLRIWDLSNGRCIKTIEAHSHFVTSLDFCLTSPLLATGSVNQDIKLWECR
ncbi:hypothetical protein H696_00315 [Fonticula alba]|uniref:Lissencephaly-1 homolog n=1 Tax=Fonticula alba TaxID=691883 RepID=A0A058ZFK6_FONAL|nr:hypothetical protein H696_00315 [Fonticula alba]KCV72736.1 hypothetical protein H696_00315 [Fonticula alba]|eukprot:XP_009492437.1 hypothetical protein H696_00315 [Fonticula alba]